MRRVGHADGRMTLRRTQCAACMLWAAERSLVQQLLAWVLLAWVLPPQRAASRRCAAGDEGGISRDGSAASDH